MADQVDRGGADLAGVVRRDRGRHAHRDAGRAIGEQVGERARQDDRFALLAIIGGTEIDRVLVDAGQQRARDLGEPRLGVAHRRGVIAVDIAEVALPFHQRIARGEILGEAHQRVVHRDVAMRVELADHVAHDAGAFLEAGGRIEPQQVHRVDQPPVHRLQPVAHIRQRARHDGGERIGEVALGQRVGQARVLDMADQVIRHPAAPIRRPAPRRGRIASGGRPAADDGDARTRRAPGSARSAAARRASPPAWLRCRPPGTTAGAAGATVQTPAPAAVTARPVFGETKARPAVSPVTAQLVRSRP